MKLTNVFFLLCGILSSMSALSTPSLSSLPSAQATIYLDFDGETVDATLWNNGNTILSVPSTLNDAQITEVFNRVSEDYRPFNINITTDVSVYLAAPLNRRVRIIVSSTSAWYPSAGGVAYTNSFTYGDDTPGFVFEDRLGPYDPKMVAEACTHESGHTLGLLHQSSYNSTCTLVSTYNSGTGTNEIGWAPIMGAAYFRNLTAWNNGPTPSGCTSNQDELTIITGANGFSYRPDDHSDDPNSNPTVIPISNQAFSTKGIITTSADKDVFQLNLASDGVLHLDANPFSVGPANDGADLDIALTLLNSSKQTINTFNDPNVLNAVIDLSVKAGTYYLIVNGVGNINAPDYGSLGSYTISGTFSGLSVTPIHSISLTGNIDKNKHNLSWNIISDEPMKTIELQKSTDGSDFTTLTRMGASARNFNYDLFTTDNIFYQLKVISVIGEVAYSNVFKLRSANSSKKTFVVSTFVHDEIMVNAPEKYQFQLLDIAGKIILKGSHEAGVNRINISTAAEGMYILQLFNGQERHTERIVKQ
ncbi:MAG: T9SS type A sorting domain-containing protein [Ginsengibacter sp.]